MMMMMEWAAAMDGNADYKCSSARLRTLVMVMTNALG